MTYHETAQLYVEAGWGVPFPLPAGRKHPPPDGLTGQHGRDLPMPSPAGFDYGPLNYGLRMPEGVMGLDVDVYGDKHGDVVIADLEARLGPLPAGPWSSSRAWPSGIRFYRIPAGIRLRGAIPGGVEIIQRHHRYAVVWPSVVEGRAYEWQGWEYDGPGWPDVPPVDMLPELPGAWLAWLQEGASDATGPAADASTVAELEAALFAVEGTCPEVAGLLADADARMAEAAEGGRHDAMTGLAFRLAHLCVAGHLSWGTGTQHLGDLWNTYVGEDRGAEFVRGVRTALAKVGPIQSSVDPCALTVGPGYVELEITADVSAFPPPLGQRREITHADRVEGARLDALRVFDPVDAYDDRALGLAVLAHVGGGVRWLLDAGGWLHRGPEAWSVSGSSLIEGARSCVATAVRTLPRGRKDAEPGSTELRRYENRRVLTSSAGLGRVASWIGAEVASAGSPLGIRLSSLDADPEVLWAGGVPWDLRRSDEQPMVAAGVDPGAPHTRAAGVTPGVRPTPLWDAFCAAVWPDPEQRAWALRVLGIAVTGYADRAMPILWGPRGRGKTQVLALVSDVLGSYAVAADPRLLGSGEHHGSVTLALAGARLAWIDEGPRSGHWATERLKALTGGGEMTGNPMRGNPVTFRPTHTLCLTSNDEPQVSDEALRSRVRSIQCGGDLEAVRDTRHAIGHLSGAVWAAERPGVLAQLMAEAAAWLDNPRTADNPHAVEAVLERLAREQDPVLSWLDDRTSPAGWTPSSVLYEDFRLYCQRSGISPSKVPSLTRWGRDLNAQGVLARRGAQGVQRDRTLHDGGSGPYTPAPVPPAAAFLRASAGSLSPVQGAESETPGAESGAESGAGSKPDLTRESAEYVELTSRDRTTSINNTKNRGSDVLAGKPEVCSDPTQPLPSEASSGLPAVVLGGAVRTLGLDDAAALLGTLAGQSVTLDVEHTGYPIGHPAYALRTIQLGTSAFCVVLDAADPEQVLVAAMTLNKAAEIVAHASQADVIPVALAWGVDPAPWFAKVTDTAVLGALADPHLTGTDRGHALDLKGLSGRLLGDPVSPQADKDRAAYFRKHKWLTNTEPTTDPARSGWAQADYAEPVMATYAASDVLDTAALRRALPEPPPELLARERRVLATTARIAERGLLLDGDWIAERRDAAVQARAGYRANLAEAGVAEPGSTQQLGARLAELGAELPKTPTGKPSTASDALEDLARYEGPAADLAQDVLAWREQDKLLGTYLEPYGLLVERGDGRVRPTVQTLGAAATGRMSVVRPNLQQVPKVGGIRGCVVADPGHLLIAADFSSVEIRVAAALSGDIELANMLREGVDVHGRISAVVWGPDWTKANRYAVKRVVFGKMYGSGRANLAKQMGEHHARVDDVIDAMEQITPGFVQWSARLQQEVRSGLRPVWRHPSGRLTYLPSETPHKAPNYAIQSTARELLVDALERWEQARPGHVLLPIHDEIVVQVPEDQAEQATLDLVACMTTDLAGVPITAEAATPSARWADAT